MLNCPHTTVLGREDMGRFFCLMCRREIDLTDWLDSMGDRPIHKDRFDVVIDLTIPIVRPRDKMN